VNSVFPGYTHLQPAQPISFAHYLLAVGDSLLRDNQRILEAYRRVNLSPLGSGALAGSSFQLNRDSEAEFLGFNGLIDNTLDAIGGRDFALETLSVFSITALDLSRVAQDIIFYSSADVGILAIPDEFTSTSSMMPQKKNPDPLEIIRAESAKVAGNCTSALTIMHGLPSGYNLDFQEITPLLWDSCDALKLCLNMLASIIPGLKPDAGIVRRDYLQYIAATEIANILVREEKFSFRSAHRAVGHSVRNALEKRKTLGELTYEEWKQSLGRSVSKKTFDSMAKTLDLAKHLEYYRTKGSPNPRQVAAMIRFRTSRVRLLFHENARRCSKLRRSLRKFSFLNRRFIS
jgi:argininosuccinate lyase